MNAPRYLAAALLLAVGLSGCQLRNRMSSQYAIPDSIPTGDTAAPTESTAAAPVPSPENSQQDKKVKELVTQEGEYTGFTGSSFTYSYHLPYIDIAGAYANTCNWTIDQQFGQVVNDQLQRIAVGDAITVDSIAYQYYVNGDILTLHITQHYMSGRQDSTFFNVCCADGSKAEASQLLAQAGIEEAEFSALLGQALEKLYDTRYGSQQSTNALMYGTQKDKTLAESNLTTDCQMYLSQDGKLVVLANLYTITGGAETVSVCLP